MSAFPGLLSLTVFLPAAGAALIVIALRSDNLARRGAFLVGLADLLLSVFVFVSFQPGAEADRFQLVERFYWISADSFNASYFLGVDGLSAPMVLLTGLLGFCAIIASWSIQVRVKEYFVWLLLLQTSLMGVFTAQDFLLFFLFWELELLPMYMLIANWGSGRREYSAMKFLIFTILGSAFMLVAIIGVFLSQPGGSFDMTRLLESAGMLNGATAALPLTAMFWLFFAAFAIKLPVWPVHTWLPDAHTDAPTAASVMLAGVMLKMGGYGLLRVNVGMFPAQIVEFAWIVMLLGVISVLYGGVVTLRQTDLKRLIANSSVSHMGLVLVGIGSVGAAAGELTGAGLSGAAMQLFTHGTITGLLFVGVGLIYDKVHTRHIPDLGGLAGRMPVAAAALVIAGFASLGLPGLSGFVSEVLVFFGGFRAYPWPTALAVTGIILAAGYILRMLERSLFGPPRERFADINDASLLEAVPLAALVASIVLVGVYPALLTNVFDAGIAPMVEAINHSATEQAAAR